MQFVSQFFALFKRLKRGSDEKLPIVFIALCVTVCSFSAASISFFSKSVQVALDNDIAQHLGAPLVIRSHYPLPNVLLSAPTTPETLANIAPKQMVRIQSYTTGAISEHNYQSVSLKGVSEHYPLTGTLQVRNISGEFNATARDLPKSTAWLDSQALAKLGVAVGDTLRVGKSTFTVAGEILFEPDRLTQRQHILPRVLVSLADLQATGVTQGPLKGEHRLLIDGTPADIKRIDENLRKALPGDVDFLKPDAGQHPFSRISARAERMMNLLLLFVLLLCGGAVATLSSIAVTRHAKKASILRCLGVNRHAITAAFAARLLSTSLFASLFGCALAWLIQPLIAELLKPYLFIRQSHVAFVDVFMPVAIAMSTVSMFVIPRLKFLSAMPVAAIMRGRELKSGKPYILTALLVAISLGVLWFSTGNKQLAVIIFVTLALLISLTVGFGFIFNGLCSQLHHLFNGATKVAIRAIGRSSKQHITPLTSVAIIVLSVLITMTLRGSFLQQLHVHRLYEDGNYIFQGLAKPDVNKFVDILEKNNGTLKQLHPVVNARLTAINGSDVEEALEQESETREEIRSQVRLSWSAELPKNNKLLKGAWPEENALEVSVEDEVMTDLNLEIGDTLTFQVGSNQIVATISSRRTYTTGGSRMMFWFMFAPGALDRFEQSYMGGALIAKGDTTALSEISRLLPTIKLIELDRLINKIRNLMVAVTRGLNTALFFLLLGALMVFIATSYLSAGTRQKQTILVRTLGLQHHKIYIMSVTEQLFVGFSACIIGILGAQCVGTLLFQSFFALPYQLNWTYALVITISVCAAFATFGWLSAASHIHQKHRLIL